MDALMLPLNWQKVRLGDIAEIKRGASPRPIENPKWFCTNSNVGWVRISDISKNSRFLYKTAQKLSKKGIEKSRFIKQNSLIMSMCATIGKPIITKIDTCIHDGFVVFENPKIDLNYLYYFLCYIEKEWLESGQQGSQVNLNVDLIKNKEVFCPKDLDEQAAIANILSDLDHYLCSLDALILKKESVKKALSFELLSQRKRLKGFNQAWQRVRLGDIGITISGLVGKTKQDFINGNAKYITFLNVLNNFIIDTSILENVKIYPNEKQNSFKKYDLFFNTSSETPKEVGMCAVLLDDIDQVFLNSFCFGFRIFDKAVDGLFLSYLINSEIGRKAFENLAQGSTRYNLSKSGFNNVCLFLPPLNEQIAIANILSDLDSEIISLKNKKRQFENIKKALNHDLMSAKIRVLNK
ncbi:restriction endonuclease subunit S [Helicobacter pylori]|uniref:restriction endonuclease subunit S n=2 Tax=Helicobacter pylori TaxID=210 RepID=UPI000BE8C8ED|nr:restriction endonuclease subunit S [Helicobacter pylori]PDW18448.1 restriction endonuclease subunit S [Helicobacter pylori]PDW31023.1 restriction endonuclease subunit S [Helicobacter pylori]